MDDLIKRCDVLEDIDEGADLLRTVLDEMDLVGSDREEFEFGLELLGALIDDIKQIPSAEPERKKGKWIKVHGFCTLGGDPVWKCSECGKGVHVYGVESYRTDISDGQWKACPGCGAEMIKD